MPFGLHVIVTDFTVSLVAPETPVLVATAVAVAEFPFLLEVTDLIIQKESYDFALGVQVVHWAIVPL